MTQRECVIAEMQKILGSDFGYKWIFQPSFPEQTSNTYPFVFKGQMPINKKAEKMIQKKIAQLKSPESQKLLGYGEISKNSSLFGQSIILTIKSITDYQCEISEHQNDIREFDKEIKEAQDDINRNQQSIQYLDEEIKQAQEKIALLQQKN